MSSHGVGLMPLPLLLRPASLQRPYLLQHAHGGCLQMLQLELLALENL
jgi:hypothetical protein